MATRVCELDAAGAVGTSWDSPSCHVRPTRPSLWCSAPSRADFPPWAYRQRRASEPSVWSEAAPAVKRQVELAAAEERLVRCQLDLGRPPTRGGAARAPPSAPSRGCHQVVVAVPRPRRCRPPPPSLRVIEPWESRTRSYSWIYHIRSRAPTTFCGIPTVQFRNHSTVKIGTHF